MCERFGSLTCDLQGLVAFRQQKSPVKHVFEFKCMQATVKIHRLLNDVGPIRVIGALNVICSLP